MNIKIALKITRDSWNSYPSEYLEFNIDEKTVGICIKGEPDRNIEISKEEFRQLCLFLIKSQE